MIGFTFPSARQALQLVSGGINIKNLVTGDFVHNIHQPAQVILHRRIGVVPGAQQTPGKDAFQNTFPGSAVPDVETSLGVVNELGQPKAAVWVLSAGPNRIIETPFLQPVMAPKSAATTSPSASSSGVARCQSTINGCQPHRPVAGQGFTLSGLSWGRA